MCNRFIKFVKIDPTKQQLLEAQQEAAQEIKELGINFHVGTSMIAGGVIGLLSGGFYSLTSSAGVEPIGGLCNVGFFAWSYRRAWRVTHWKYALCAPRTPSVPLVLTLASVLGNLIALDYTCNIFRDAASAIKSDKVYVMKIRDMLML